VKRAQRRHWRQRYLPGDDPEQTADDVKKIETAITLLFTEKHFDQATGK